MSEEIVSTFEQDMGAVDPARLKADEDVEKTMKLIAHVFLRLWTRIAIETGQKLTLTPFQHSLGMYHGQMNWILNESFNFGELPQMELGTAYGRRHALVAEMYRLNDQDRARIFFSLDEEEVKGRPVSVNYLLYDSTTKDFSLDALVGALKPVVPKWLETVMGRADGPLWEYCKQNLECTGI
jgi:hypothetical protein